MLLKIVRPQDQMTVRLEGELTVNDIQIAKSFNRNALSVRDEKEKVLFDVDFGSTRIGPCGLRINRLEFEPDEKIQVLIVINADDEVSFRSSVANTQKHLKTVTTQIQAAVKEYSELKIDEI